MMLSRRSLVLSALATSGTLPPLSAMASQATPAASPIAELLPPKMLYDRLLNSSITSPLFPSDTPGLDIVVWDDSNDRDLQSVIGGLLVRSGPNEEDFIGAYIVHPTNDQAVSRLAPIPDDEETVAMDVLGHRGVWQQTPAQGRFDPSTLIAVAASPVLISAFVESPDIETNNLRAMANLMGLLDHLRLVSLPD